MVTAGGGQQCCQLGGPAISARRPAVRPPAETSGVPSAPPGGARGRRHSTRLGPAPPRVTFDRRTPGRYRADGREGRPVETPRGPPGDE